LSDKPNEAIDMLKESNALDDIEPEIHEQLRIEQWKPDEHKSAKAVLYYNLAVALTLRGDLDKAGELLKQVRPILKCCFHFLIKLNYTDNSILSYHKLFLINICNMKYMINSLIIQIHLMMSIFCF